MRLSVIPTFPSGSLSGTASRWVLWRVLAGLMVVAFTTLSGPAAAQRGATDVALAASVDTSDFDSLAVRLSPWVLSLVREQQPDVTDVDPDTVASALRARVPAESIPSIWAYLDSEAYLDIAGACVGCTDPLNQRKGSEARDPVRANLAVRYAHARYRPNDRLLYMQRLLAQIGRDHPDVYERIQQDSADVRALSQSAPVPPTPIENLWDYRVAMWPGLALTSLRTATEFYESAAGRALLSGMFEAAIRTTVPIAMAQTVTDWNELAPVQIDPVLVGGMAGLQSRVDYPRLAREAGIEGRVFVQFVVDETGAVIDPVVTRSPSELLSEAALRAVHESRFVPGTQNGRPVKVRFSLPINFVLDDTEIVEVPDKLAEVVGGLDAIQAAITPPAGAPSGTVFVRVVTDPLGAVTDAKVTRSPDPALDQAAVDAVLAVDYVPAVHRGKRVHSALMVRVRF